MKPTPPPASGGYPEHNERPEKAEQAEGRSRSSEVRQATYDTPHSDMEQEQQLDALLDAGFAWEEAVTLLNLREHLYENAEMRQRMMDNPRLNFARWLYLNGEMNEGEQ